MTQELFASLISHPIMDGQTSLHISENEIFKSYEEKYVKQLSKITFSDFESIFVSIFINIKTKGSNIDTIYNGQKIFLDLNVYNADVDKFIDNLNNLITSRHGEIEAKKLNLSVVDIK